MYRIRTTPFVEAAKAGAAPLKMDARPVVLPSAPEEPVARALVWARAAYTSERMGMHERALELYERALGLLSSMPQRWDLTATIHNNLASILRFTGKIAEAEAHYVEAINELESLPSPEAATIRNRMLLNLADLYHQTGHAEEALDLVESAAVMA
jgi:tetratricopeptide (TPR) repeat protein